MYVQRYVPYFPCSILLLSKYTTVVLAVLHVQQSTFLDSVLPDQYTRAGISISSFGLLDFVLRFSAQMVKTASLNETLGLCFQVVFL